MLSLCLAATGGEVALRRQNTSPRLQLEDAAGFELSIAALLTAAARTDDPYEEECLVLDECDAI